MIMRMSKVRFQTIIMAVLCLFVKIQVAHASAKVGEATAQLQISVAYFCSIGLYFLV